MSPLAPTTQAALFGDQVPRVKDFLDDIGVAPEKRSYTADQLQNLRDSNIPGAVQISDARIYDRIKREESPPSGVRRDQSQDNGIRRDQFQMFRQPLMPFMHPSMFRANFGSVPATGQNGGHHGGGNHSGGNHGGGQHSSGNHGSHGSHGGGQGPRRQPNRDHMMRRGQPDKARHPIDPSSTPGSRNFEALIRISLNRDVKLKEAENAWKPKHLQQASKDTADDLHRQVRSILNKLTAKNFAALSDQFQKLPIDTTDKLGDVIKLVFDKAVDEPSFSECYAQLCLFLSNRSKQMDTSSECKFFKRALIQKLQHEFEQNVGNQHTMEAALQPLQQKLKDCEKAADAAGIREAKELVAEEESRIRRRLVSTVQFIGELFKLDMLTPRIMNMCLQTLIDHGTDEKLECACKLLTTIGKKLEPKPADKAKGSEVTAFMAKLKQITEKKKSKVNTRTKFMIMEVIDMRANGWRKMLIA